MTAASLALICAAAREAKASHYAWSAGASYVLGETHVSDRRAAFEAAFARLTRLCADVEVAGMTSPEAQAFALIEAISAYATEHDVVRGDPLDEIVGLAVRLRDTLRGRA